jgi:hypothetical protein
LRDKLLHKIRGFASQLIMVRPGLRGPLR